MAEKTVNRQYEKAVGERLAKLLDGQLTQLVPIPSWPDSIVYKGMGEKQSLILKMIDPNGRDKSRIVEEAWTLQQASQVGVPVPNVVFVDESCVHLPATYMVMEQARGVDLRDGVNFTDAELKPYLLEIGRNLRKLHAIKLAGFGFLKALSNGSCRGEHADWKTAALASTEAGFQKLVANPHFPQKYIGIAREVIRENTYLLESVDQGSLLHGDMGLVHCFANLDEAKITGFIDFGECKAGDPVWDFVDIRWRHVDAVLEGYAPDAALRAAFDDRFYLYAILRNLIWTVRWNDHIPKAVAQQMAFLIEESGKHFGLIQKGVSDGN